MAGDPLGGGLIMNAASRGEEGHRRLLLPGTLGCQGRTQQAEACPRDGEKKKKREGERKGMVGAEWREMALLAGDPHGKDACIATAPARQDIEELAQVGGRRPAGERRPVNASCIATSRKKKDSG